MPNIHLKVNGTSCYVYFDSSTLLLWVLRNQINVTGINYSCGIGLCAFDVKGNSEKIVKRSYAGI